MSIFDNISKKAANLAQNAAKKSGELVETTKLNFNINSEEDKIQKNLIQIGRIILSDYKSGEEVKPEIKMICENIQSSETTIDILKDRILNVKSMKLCTNCNNKIEKNTLFCPDCGANQEAIDSTTVEEKFCTVCGKQAEDSHAFCSGCGSKL